MSPSAPVVAEFINTLRFYSVWLKKQNKQRQDLHEFKLKTVPSMLKSHKDPREYCGFLNNNVKCGDAVS